MEASLDLGISISGGVDTDPGLLSAFLAGPVGPSDGLVTTIWDGEGNEGLGGIDLMAAGDFFRLDVALLVEFGLSGMDLQVTDTEGGVSRIETADLGFGINLLPFALLSGDADLTSIDAIQMELNLGGDPNTTPLIEISDFRVVPEPGTALLFGSALLGLIGIARRKRAA